MDLSTERSCIVCGTTENLQRCSRCLEAYYCSAAHQLQDWRNHKKVCREPAVEHSLLDLLNQQKVSRVHVVYSGVVDGGDVQSRSEVVLDVSFGSSIETVADIIEACVAHWNLNVESRHDDGGIMPSFCYQLFRRDEMLDPCDFLSHLLLRPTEPPLVLRQVNTSLRIRLLVLGESSSSSSLASSSLASLRARVSSLAPVITLPLFTSAMTLEQVPSLLHTSLRLAPDVPIWLCKPNRKHKIQNLTQSVASLMARYPYLVVCRDDKEEDHRHHNRPETDDYFPPKPSSLDMVVDMWDSLKDSMGFPEVSSKTILFVLLLTLIVALFAIFVRMK